MNATDGGNFERVAKQYHRQHVAKAMKDVDPMKLGSELKEFFKEESREEEHSEDEGPSSPAARGHMGGLIGGPKRDEVLTSAAKEKIARKGGHARWGEGKSERE